MGTRGAGGQSARALGVARRGAARSGGEARRGAAYSGAVAAGTGRA